jgi:ribosomal-protein-serine acetyltransferase
MDPLLIDVPTRIETARLILRAPQPGDGTALNEAVCESLDTLRPWMPWAQAAPSLDESEAYCRRQHAHYTLRAELPLFIFERSTDDGEGRLVGATGLHNLDWTVRRFEIGYWRRGRERRGEITEAVVALSRMAFDTLQARRVEIRMDENNRASRRVAERAGFTFEGLLRNDTLTPQGEPRNTRVYSRVRGIEEAEPPAPTAPAKSGRSRR